jgi:uncharacterized damage-inducible protein DinB
MPIINALLPELDNEAKTTVRVLERVPGEHLSWTPHPKSSSLGKLAWHIASVPATVQRLLRDGTFDLGQPRPAQQIPDNTPAIVEEFRRNSDATREYLTTLTDEVLHEPFSMIRGEQTLMTITKVGVVRTILMNHTYHHRGQLAVYLRLLDVPVPTIYGSTADEAM